MLHRTLAMGLPSRDTLRQAMLFGPIAAGLAASSILLVDYLRPAPVFCGLESGCDVVKRTILAWVGPVPTPAFGVLGFLLVAALAFWRGARARLLMLATTSIAAAVAAWLVWVQTQIQAYCKYCLVADSCFVLLLLVATWRVRARWDLPEAAPRRAMLGALAGCLAVPMGLSLVMKPDVPAVIEEEIKQTPPGKVTVVDFVDFECPFCRATHKEVAPVLEANKDGIRMVRKHVPLTRIHKQAMSAARAACCAEQLGKGDQMAEALFESEDLSPDACARLAQTVGVDLDAYKRCIDDPSTDARIQKDGETFKAAHGHGLPTIWIGEERIEGAQPAAKYASALARARRN
jgi:protein-disulfide isomerase/uncharacterized membrane protein